MLGVSRNDDFPTTRKHYYSLVREHHPDRLIARGVPASFHAIANDRMARYNARLCGHRARAQGCMSGFMPDYEGADVVASPNFGARRDGRAPDTIILHYTGMPTAEGALDWLTRSESEVSSHYFVFEDGRVVQLVRKVPGPGMRARAPGRARWTSIRHPSVSRSPIPAIPAGCRLFRRRRSRR